MRADLTYMFALRVYTVQSGVWYVVPVAGGGACARSTHTLYVAYATHTRESRALVCTSMTWDSESQ
eukprot:5943482-Prymnesium_polylepis.1